MAEDTVVMQDTGIFDPESIVAEVEQAAKEKKINPKLAAKRRLEEMMERKRLDGVLKEYYDDEE
ncbi:MAG: hypothetical protein AAF438_21135 [Pseudomonadota bacterium]